MSKRTYSIDAPDQARLKQARIEIEAVLKKHDLAGAVVLHTPGMTEWFYDIRPSYSCVSVDEAAQRVHIRSKLADYGGDAQAQLHDQAATANMLQGLAHDLAQGGLMFVEVSRYVSKVTNATHTPAVRVADPMEGKPQ